MFYGQEETQRKYWKKKGGFKRRKIPNTNESYVVRIMTEQEDILVNVRTGWQNCKSYEGTVKVMKIEKIELE